MCTHIHFYGYYLDQHNQLLSNLGSKLKTKNLSEMYPLPFELHKIKNGTEANSKAAHRCWDTLKWTAQGRFLMHFPPLSLLHCLWVCWLQRAGSVMQRRISGAHPTPAQLWAVLSQPQCSTWKQPNTHQGDAHQHFKAISHAANWFYKSLNREWFA